MFLAGLRLDLRRELKHFPRASSCGWDGGGGGNNRRKMREGKKKKGRKGRSFVKSGAPAYDI